MRTLLGAFGLLLVLAVGAAALFIYSGVYDVGADEPHWPVTSQMLETMRHRSTERRAASVPLPNLDDPELVLKGAGQYAAMCAGCHLAPGVEPNELSRGLYPPPPQLAKIRVDPRFAFTTVKHGIKMTGMPAWGGHHPDQEVWSVVAFLQKLPDLSPQKYKELVGTPQARMAGNMAAHGALAAPAPGAGSPSGGKETLPHTDGHPAGK